MSTVKRRFFSLKRPFITAKKAKFARMNMAFFGT